MIALLKIIISMLVIAGLALLLGIAIASFVYHVPHYVALIVLLGSFSLSIALFLEDEG